jgi:hypothetical protein
MAVEREIDSTKQVMYRQGDVLLRKVDSKPVSVKKVENDKGRVILAYGEVTGHAHAISPKEAELYVSEDQRRFLEVCFGMEAVLTHEEHDKVTLPVGTYEVIMPREFSVLSQMSRQVQD